MGNGIYAITAKNNAGITNVIITPVQISNTFTKKQETTNAIWDTGATNSVITKSVAQKLNLTPFSIAEVRGVHGVCEVNVYFVQIRINNGKIILNSTVTEGDEFSADGSTGFLIGMDIINLGDFSITNNKNTVMSFQIPSTHDHDYVQEYNEKFHTPAKAAKTPERNDPCPCGSGKKYKNCCMK